MLVLDQISRPYFPTSGEAVDEAEIGGDEEEDFIEADDIEDDDIRAMRQHIDFLFAEVARRTGLQVLLIEHAGPTDDPRYVAATRARWDSSIRTGADTARLADTW